MTFSQEQAGIRAEYRMGHDPHDKWACVMGAFFEVAEALYGRGADVPPEWQFSPGIGACDESDGEGADLWTVEYSSRALVDFGRTLNRYSDMLRSRGDDY